MLDPTILPSPTPTSTPPLSPTSMSRSPLSPTSTRSPLLSLLPPSLPTMLPLSPTPDTPSLPLPTLELTLPAFPTTVNFSTPFQDPRPLFPPKYPARDAATFDSMRADLHQLLARQPVTMNPYK